MATHLQSRHNVYVLLRRNLMNLSWNHQPLNSTQAPTKLWQPLYTLEQILLTNLVNCFCNKSSKLQRDFMDTLYIKELKSVLYRLTQRHLFILRMQAPIEKQKVTDERERFWCKSICLVLAFRAINSTHKLFESLWYIQGLHRKTDFRNNLEKLEITTFCVRPWYVAYYTLWAMQ